MALDANSLLSFWATSALSLTLCQHLAKPHHPSCSSQTLPVPLIHWRVSQVSLRSQNLEFPPPSKLLPCSKRDFVLCLCSPESRQSWPGLTSCEQLCRAQNQHPRGSRGWNSALAPPAPLSSEEPAAEVVVASLEPPFSRMNLWGSWKMGQLSSAQGRKEREKGRKKGKGERMAI